MALRSALAPSMTNSRRRSTRSPRSTNSSSRPRRDGRVLGRAFPKAQNVLPAGRIDTHRHQHVVVPEHDPVEVTTITSSSFRSRSASSCRTRVPASIVSRETSDLLMPTWSAIAGSTFS